MVRTLLEWTLARVDWPYPCCAALLALPSLSWLLFDVAPLRGPILYFKAYYFEFYKESLVTACNEIKEKKEIESISLMFILN